MFSRLKCVLALLALVHLAEAQDTKNQQDSIHEKYLNELKSIGREFAQTFYPNYAKYYILPEKSFVAKIDSARQVFLNLLNNYKASLDENYFQEQSIEIKYYFDRLLIDYPLNHDIYIGKTSRTPSGIPQRLQSNISEFDNPALLTNTDFTNYVKAFLSFEVSNELKKTN